MDWGGGSYTGSVFFGDADSGVNCACVEEPGAEALLVASLRCYVWLGLSGC